MVLTQWTVNGVTKLEKMEKGNRPTGLIAYELGRSEYVIRSKANELGISLNRQIKVYITDGKNKSTHNNSRFAIGGVSWSAVTFVQSGSTGLRINICGENPTHRKSAKRLNN
ncbi:MAG: hypothetical protein IPJ86_15980 [Bacteroidetes bacterium]|jgi:hypothetical protein|nr:hypothetical protein [Bacteroidota bacterium]